MFFLHGVLHLKILEGKGLPNMDFTFFSTSKNCSDPYVTVDICKKGKRTCRIAKSSIVDNSLDPHWQESFRVDICHQVESFLFSVKDADLISVDCIGFMTIRSEELVAEKPISGWFPLLNADGDPAGSIRILMHYQCVSSISRTNEVPDTVYPMHRNCSVQLYQDAHTPAIAPVTDVSTIDGKPYTPPQLWKDITRHIEAAKKLIYITGWSVKPDLSLEREGDCKPLGELLKKKASEGVRVLLLVWNEVTSNEVSNSGILMTHDEDTEKYFEYSEVKVILATRRKRNGKLFENQFVSTFYTHHQKSIVLDVEAEEANGKRKLAAYIGGLDLSDGRWDTPEHPLFKTLACEHFKDFYNGIIGTTVNIGPRQPWHDIHAFVEGPVVLDILSNFTERWVSEDYTKENLLASLSAEELDLKYESTKYGWNCQFFRSINSDSARFPLDCQNKLQSKKGKFYESTIQMAYIHHIRRARRFIYFENQYFLGSSYAWLEQDAKCSHLVPLEIATRVIKAIENDEDFKVYIIVPIHPEGDPASNVVQEILYWQYRTIEMMYHKIAAALKRVNSSAHPTDYLTFFCLGKQESSDEIPSNLEHPKEGSQAEAIRTRLRFMIYVHSKMAIMDDEYVIVGSANINERSLNGNRDTEMAIGAYETEHTKEKYDGGLVRGSVHTFRRSLWAEHCGQNLEDHLDPSKDKCMQSMRKMAGENLKFYLGDKPEHRDSHLLLYPIDVDKEGLVSTREDCKTFPGTNACVLGEMSCILPNSLTT